MFSFFFFLMLNFDKLVHRNTKICSQCQATDEGRGYLCGHRTHGDSAPPRAPPHLQVAAVLGAVQEGHFTLGSSALLGGFQRGLLCFQLIGLHLFCLPFCGFIHNFCFLCFLHLLSFSLLPSFFSRLLRGKKKN